MTKLKEIEALAKKLGCPANIILKLMLREIETIIINYSYRDGYAPEYTEFLEVYVEDLSESFCNEWIIKTSVCDVPLGDYGSDWWLEEDLKELERLAPNGMKKD